MSRSADLLLSAYAAGFFPMADPNEENEIYWYAPDPRAILPLDKFRISRSLKARLRRGEYEISENRAFDRVIEHCADREETWISDEIVAAYRSLHVSGFAHSVEVWEAENLVGGLYGVAIGGAFFGESMFSKKSDASKIALVHLVERLERGGFVLLDIQFMTDHLRQFGAIEISKTEYEERLERALEVHAEWN